MVSFDSGQIGYYRVRWWLNDLVSNLSPMMGQGPSAPYFSLYCGAFTVYTGEGGWTGSHLATPTRKSRVYSITYVSG